MPRIRSIHPGIFTDEAFMTASPHARLLIIGLWCEAFDDGCVDLKPVTLKVRIFPNDNVDVSALLNELEGLGYFHRFTAAGKEWGAIRNFRKFQRPKKPNKSNLLTPALADFVGLPKDDKDYPGAPSSEPEPDLFPTGGEIAPQREEIRGGDKVEEKKVESQHGTAESEPSRDAEPGRADDLRSFERDCRGLFPERDQPKGSFAPMALLVERGAKPDEVIVVLRAEAVKHRSSPIASWPGWAKVVGDRLAASPSPSPPKPSVPALRFTGRKVNTPRAGALAEDFLRAEHAAGRWKAAFGPAPGLPGCVLTN